MQIIYSICAFFDTKGRWVIGERVCIYAIKWVFVLALYWSDFCIYFTKFRQADILEDIVLV